MLTILIIIVNNIIRLEAVWRETIKYSIQIQTETLTGWLRLGSAHWQQQDDIDWWSRKTLRVGATGVCVRVCGTVNNSSSVRRLSSCMLTHTPTHTRPGRDRDRWTEREENWWIVSQHSAFVPLPPLGNPLRVGQSTLHWSVLTVPSGF